MTKVGLMPGWSGMENDQQPRIGKNMESQKENSPQLDRGKNGQKMVRKNEKPASKIHRLAIFCLCPAGGCFPFGFPFFLKGAQTMKCKL